MAVAKKKVSAKKPAAKKVANRKPAGKLKKPVTRSGG